MKTWDEPCPECEEILLLSNLRTMHRDATKAAVFYEENRGLASDPRVIADLYRSVARLAEIVGAANSTNNPTSNSREGSDG